MFTYRIISGSINEGTPPFSELWKYGAEKQLNIIAVVLGGGGDGSFYALESGGNGGAIEGAYGDYVFSDNLKGRQSNTYNDVTNTVEQTNSSGFHE